jgi:hypothetical protein
MASLLNRTASDVNLILHCPRQRFYSQIRCRHHQYRSQNPYAKFCFAEKLTIPSLLLGNLKREHNAWTSSPADSVAIAELPGTIVFSSGSSIPPTAAPPPGPLSGPSSVRNRLSVHDEAVAACEAVLKGTSCRAFCRAAKTGYPSGS